jgi:hypothetical protein
MILYVAIVLLIAELISIIFWFTPYYRNGLSIYKRRLKKYNSISEFNADKTVILDRSSGYFIKEAGPKTILFWELPLVFWIFTYAPIMRGVITYNNSSDTLEVHGKHNISVSLFLLYIAVYLGNGPNYYIAWGVTFTIWTLSYLIQYLRFSSYAKEIARRLTTPNIALFR